MIINFHYLLGPAGYYSRIKVDQILNFPKSQLFIIIDFEMQNAAHHISDLT